MRKPDTDADATTGRLRGSSGMFPALTTQWAQPGPARRAGRSGYRGHLGHGAQGGLGRARQRGANWWPAPPGSPTTFDSERSHPGAGGEGEADLLGAQGGGEEDAGHLGVVEAGPLHGRAGEVQGAKIGVSAESLASMGIRAGPVSTTKSTSVPTEVRQEYRSGSGPRPRWALTSSASTAVSKIAPPRGPAAAWAGSRRPLRKQSVPTAVAAWSCRTGAAR